MTTMNVAVVKLISFAVVLISGCTVFEPPESWVEFDPPLEYHIWYPEVERCIGVRRPFEKIIWRKVEVFPNVFHCGGSDKATGCFARPNVIYIVSGAINDEPTVKSEMIHYIRQSGKHDQLFFRCGEV